MGTGYPIIDGKAASGAALTGVTIDKDSITVDDDNWGDATLAIVHGGTGAVDAPTVLTNMGLTATASEINTVCDGSTAKNSHTHVVTVDNADWSGDDLAIVNGGTGASDAATALSNLGLTATASEVNTVCDGTTAKNSHSHEINNNDWSGADLAVVNGGTGASNAITALSNLGLTATAIEINAGIDGLTATAAEINTVCDGTTAKNSHTHTVNNGDWSGTELAIVNGGTGAGDAATALSNLGLSASAASIDTACNGSTAKNSHTHTINGGDWSGADLAITDGGTGASSAVDALSNLGLTATAAEINTACDGSAAKNSHTHALETLPDLGVTATADEINTACDGVTATASEINTTCDGATAKNSHTHSINNDDWSGADLAVTNGGTGGSDASTARTNLSVGYDPCWHNVKAYGAVGNGTTDDTTAIAAAIAAASNFDTVFFPPGNYLVSSGLTCDTDYVTLMGCGAMSSMLINTGAGDSFVFLSLGGGTSNAGIGVKNMGFSSSAGTTSGVELLFGSSYGFLENLFFGGMTTFCVRLNGQCSWNTVQNVLITGNGAAGSSRVADYGIHIKGTSISSATDYANSATGNTYNNIRGEAEYALIKADGGGFGDITITNVNAILTTSLGNGVAGVWMVSDYTSPGDGYADHIAITGVHTDGAGDYSVLTYECQAVAVCGVTAGGAVGTAGQEIVRFTGTATGCVAAAYTDNEVT